MHYLHCLYGLSEDKKTIIGPVGKTIATVEQNEPRDGILTFTYTEEGLEPLRDSHRAAWNLAIAIAAEIGNYTVYDVLGDTVTLIDFDRLDTDKITYEMHMREHIGVEHVWVIYDGIRLTSFEFVDICGHVKLRFTESPSCNMVNHWVANNLDTNKLLQLPGYEHLTAAYMVSQATFRYRNDFTSIRDNLLYYVGTSISGVAAYVYSSCCCADLPRNGATGLIYLDGKAHSAIHVNGVFYIQLDHPSRGTYSVPELSLKALDKIIDDLGLHHFGTRSLTGEPMDRRIYVHSKVVDMPIAILDLQTKGIRTVYSAFGSKLPYQREITDYMVNRFAV